MSQPYTHADYARKVVVDTFRGEPLTLRIFHVQARVMGAVCCARIVDAWDTADGMEMFKLDLRGPLRGMASVPARNVRQCQGVDGHCVCAPADPLPGTGAPASGGARDSAAGAPALPDGNHGEYFPEATE